MGFVINAIITMGEKATCVKNYSIVVLLFLCTLRSYENMRKVLVNRNINSTRRFCYFSIKNSGIAKYKPIDFRKKLLRFILQQLILSPDMRSLYV